MTPKSPKDYQKVKPVHPPMQPGTTLPKTEAAAKAVDNVCTTVQDYQPFLETLHSADNAPQQVGSLNLP